MTGKAFKHVLQRRNQNTFMFNSILRKGRVYARMSPDDKALLVDSLQDNLKINCGMCGDGANDCGALKTAAVGISLSEAEASIAAPFTSKVQDIRCVEKLLIEGKAAMATSFQSFKFIELYSMIQLITCVMLYCIGSNITDRQFLYIDLVALVPLSVVQAWTGSYHKLTKDVPTATLFYFPVLLSVIVSSLI
jgi:cation-transporting ATPase 13A2